jgi:hypothetical protein
MVAAGTPRTGMLTHPRAGAAAAAGPKHAGAGAGGQARAGAATAAGLERVGSAAASHLGAMPALVALGRRRASPKFQERSRERR